MRSGDRDSAGAPTRSVRRSISTDSPVRIVGVMPAGFGFPHAETQVWLPMGLDPSRRFGWINSGIGRLKPGVSVEHAHKQTTAIMWDWARRAPDLAGGKSIPPERTHMTTIVAPLQEAMTKRTARPLIVLLAAVGLILLISIANVATLLSSRAAIRQREIGLRAALGATSGRVMRQLLTESVALALLGAVAGVALAFGAVRVFTTHARHAAALARGARRRSRAGGDARRVGDERNLVRTLARAAQRARADDRRAHDARDRATLGSAIEQRARRRAALAVGCVC